MALAHASNWSITFDPRDIYEPQERPAAQRRLNKARIVPYLLLVNRERPRHLQERAAARRERRTRQASRSSGAGSSSSNSSGSAAASSGGGCDDGGDGGGDDGGDGDGPGGHHSPRESCVLSGCGVTSAEESLPYVLTVEEAAELLRVDRKTIYESIRRGELPGVVRLGRSIRIGRDALLQFLAGKGRVSHKGETP